MVEFDIVGGWVVGLRPESTHRALTRILGEKMAENGLEKTKLLFYLLIKGSLKLSGPPQ